jgi:hypothetical protein
MMSKTKIVLVAAMMLGAASAARASGDTDSESGGFQVQTWQEIQQAQQEIKNQVAASEGKSAYGQQSPSHKTVAHTKSQSRDN